MNQPLLIAHRGDTVNFPENTLDAFASAFEKGADGVEMDVHLHNGTIIIVHNYLFDRNKTYPDLRDVLKAIHDKGRVEIEVKAFSTDILPVLKTHLDLFPHIDAEITTSITALCRDIHNTFPYLPCGLIVKESKFESWMPENIVVQMIQGLARLAIVKHVHLPFRVLQSFGQAGLVEKLHESDLIIHSHILKSPLQHEELDRLTEWKIDSCTVDDISLTSSR